MKQSTCVTPEAHANIPGDNQRENLILKHLEQVRIIARRIYRKIPASIEQADLVGVGILGLIDAVEKFDPALSVQFKTYAEHRIRGAMLDSLRNLDWAPRTLRSKSRNMQSVCGALEQSLGRASTEEERSEALGVSLNKYHELSEKMARMTWDSLDMGAEANERTSSPAERIPDSPASLPYAIFEKSEIRDVVSEAIDDLPKRERLVVSLYYYEELPMSDIGRILGIKESRISQLHASAIRRLKKKLRCLREAA